MRRASCYYTTALILSFITFFAVAIAFIIPYWLVSWAQKHSTFNQIGLWMVCFTAFSDPKLYAYKYYSGCWWTFHPELDAIRDMLHPAWFKAVQAFVVISLLSSLCAVLSLLIGKALKSTVDMTVSAFFTGITVLFGLLSVIVFGSCAKDPRMYNLPWPQYNYFSGGFALIIISVLTSSFGLVYSIASMKSDSIEKRR